MLFLLFILTSEIHLYLFVIDYKNNQNVLLYTPKRTVELMQYKILHLLHRTLGEPIGINVEQIKYVDGAILLLFIKIQTAGSSLKIGISRLSHK